MALRLQTLSIPQILPASPFQTDKITQKQFLEKTEAKVQTTRIDYEDFMVAELFAETSIVEGKKKQEETIYFQSVFLPYWM